MRRRPFPGVARSGARVPDGAPGKRLALPGVLGWALLLPLGCASEPSGGETLGGPDAAADVPGMCAPQVPELGQASAALTVVDRSLVGAPGAYPADLALGQRELEVWRSQRARRALAWQVAARVLSPVPLVQSVGSGAPASLPLWQTWHNKDDLTRIFRRLYPELSPDEQRTRAPFGGAALDAASSWNDGAVADYDTWTEERLTAYRAAIDTAAKLGGIGGVNRVAYAPGTSRHVLESYSELLGCREAEGAADAPPDVASPACPPTGYAPACLVGQFPTSSVLVKATWQRLGVGTPVPAYDTSAEALAQRLSPERAFEWGAGDRQAEPGESEMYTLELENGNRFGLTGLHIMTKELEHWVWLTLWWSDDPDVDFGADRPPEFPSPFDHYKLCSVVAFEEGDAYPSGGFEGDAPSLAAALSATASGGGGATWCSNPYIELGAGNASTNCIGCHQHAGTALRSEDILADPALFKNFGRTLQRSSFDADYVFSVRTGDDVGAMFAETESHFTETGPPLE